MKGNVMNKKDEDFILTMMKSHNYLGAYEVLKQLDISKAERAAYVGEILQAAIEDLAISSKQSKEKTIYLRTIITYVSKEFPGLANLYREQLRIATGKDDLFTELFKGAKNVGDVATGKKTLEEGVEQAKEDIQTGFESMFGTSVDSIAKEAGTFFSQGLEQLSSFFGSPGPEKKTDQSKEERESKNPSDSDDTSEESVQDIIIENENDPVRGPMKSLDKDK
jgi:hypothetical protein